jgi:hypothetical protein
MKILIIVIAIILQGCTSPKPETNDVQSTERDREKNTVSDIEKTVNDISAFYIDGIVTLMMYEKMEYKESFRNIFLERPDIVDAYVVRNSKIYKGILTRQPQDELSNKLFEGSMGTIAEVNQNSKILSVGVPFTATENTRGVNCMICHDVPVGTVLGVLRLDYSLSIADTRNLSEFRSKIRSYLCADILPKKAC